MTAYPTPAGVQVTPTFPISVRGSVLSRVTAVPASSNLMGTTAAPVTLPLWGQLWPRAR